MSLKIRRAIYLSFIAAFFIAAPLVVLYATGYRWRGLSLSPTSTLVATTQPSGASIIIDNEETNLTSPNSIRSLAAGLHTLTLTKDGYHDWTKRLSLYPGQATFASGVRLWPKTTPQPITTTPPSHISLSPNGRYLATLSAEPAELSILTIATNTATPVRLPAPLQTATRLAWSPNSQLLLVGGQSATGLVKMATLNAPTVRLLPSANNYQFITNDRGSVSSANKLFLYSFEASEGQNDETALELTTTLAPSQIIDATISTPTHYVLVSHTAAGTALLTWVNSSDQGITGSQALPDGVWHVVGSNGQYAVLQSNRNHLLVMNLEKPDAAPLLSVANITGVTFAASSSEVAYTLPFELWTFAPASNTQALITRLSEPLHSPLLLGGGVHLAFVANQDIRVIERDGRDTRNVWTLVSDINPIQFITNNDSSALYFGGRLAEQSGLWSLDLGPSSSGLF